MKNLLTQAMAVTSFLVRVFLTLIQKLPLAGDELDEATRERMAQRAQFLNQETTCLWQEMDKMSQEQSGFAVAALLVSALQHWQFWLFAGDLVLFFGLWWWLRKRSQEEDSSSEESFSENTEEVEEEGEEEYCEDANDLEGISEEQRQWLKQDMARGRNEAEVLMLGFVLTIRCHLSNSFFPVLELPIGVGSAFEGWGPCGSDPVYRLLVPLKPRHGYTFHLEPDTAGEMPARSFRIRVELLCSCTMEQRLEITRCLLHHPEEDLRGIQAPAPLHTLCTGYYLDVEKTVCWFSDNLKAVWKDLPASSQSLLTMLPSDRSCKFQVTKGNRKIFTVDVVFGVQQGNSDIFLSSQATQATFTPSTTWLESYDVAEVKFFRHIARQAPYNNFHLKCLQTAASILVGIGFTTYTLKTVVMHLLTIIPLSGQHKGDHLLLLLDALQYLCCCLAEKRLNHFFFGNKSVPKEIVLPSHFQMAEPLNLFQHLAQDPDAHTKAWREFLVLRDRLRNVVMYGY
ncbi:inositol 1,4,5-trisphosphate receptor-interacting protein-like 1 [Phaenicophaeus curvirostris]|uniref:inositol 1,4,5-trisphosphate receptor-interacting protein-like 1 n=1 Tax=Phaenicophaeus curvirostris TaxID=33595 RepID=UPI0037F0C7F7